MLILFILLAKSQTSDFNCMPPGRIPQLHFCYNNVKQ